MGLDTRVPCASVFCPCVSCCARTAAVSASRVRVPCRSARPRGSGAGSWVSVILIVSSVYFLLCSSITRQIRHPSSPIKCTQSTAHTMQARLPPVYHLRALTQPPRRSRRYRQGSQSRPRIALSRSLRHGRPPRRCRSPLFVLVARCESDQGRTPSNHP